MSRLMSLPTSSCCINDVRSLGYLSEPREDSTPDHPAVNSAMILSIPGEPLIAAHDA